MLLCHGRPISSKGVNESSIAPRSILDHDAFPYPQHSPPHHTMMQSPAPSSSEDSTWGAAVGAAWRAHALALETRAIEAACEERLRHVPASSSASAAAAASAIRQWADTAVRALECLTRDGKGREPS